MNKKKQLYFNGLNKHLEPYETELLEPMKIMRLDEIDRNLETLHSAGMEELENGKVAIVLLAGGLATRLGLNCPKGMVDIGISKKICLFDIYIGKLKDTCKKINRDIDLYIMVNKDTARQIKTFFTQNNYFGYKKEHIFFFEQKLYPKMFFDGKPVFEKRGSVAMAPGGNGEWIEALRESGYLKKMLSEGIQWINLLSIDNPLYKIVDIDFLGACVLKKVQMAVQVVEKVNPYEKMGVICCNNGRPFVKEYYELSKDEQESLYNEKSCFRYGVLLNYMISFNDVIKIDTSVLPIHFANKKIPYIDASGKEIVPQSENGYIMEKLALDIIPMFERVLAYEVDRRKSFAPIKNLKGEDSLDSARELLIQNGYEL